MSKREYCIYTRSGWLLATDREYPPEPERGILVKVLLLGNSFAGKSTFLGRLQTGIFPPHYAPYTIGVEFAQKFMSSSGGLFPDDVKLQVWDDMNHQRYRAITRSYFRNASVFLFCFEHRTVIHPTPPKKWSGFPPLAAAVEEAFHSIKPWICEFSGPSRQIDFPLLPVVVGMKTDLLEDTDELSLINALEEEPLEDVRLAVGERLEAEFPSDEGKRRAAADRYLAAFTNLMELRVKSLIEDELGESTSFPVRCFHTSSKTGRGVDELLQYVADTMQVYRTRGPNGGERCRAGAIRLPSLSRGVVHSNHSTMSQTSAANSVPKGFCSIG